MNGALVTMGAPVFLTATPLPSVTVRVGAMLPAVAYVWLGFCSLLVAPSPKSHAYVIGPQPPVALAWNFTVSGVSPLSGLADSVASSGGQLAVTDALLVAGCFLESVIVSDAVYVPSLSYVCFGF